MSTMEQIDEAIGEADIYISRVRDLYEILLEESFKLSNKVLSEEEVIRFNEIEIKRLKIKKYINSINNDFSSLYSRIFKKIWFR
jgi:hypothetical protein